MKAKVKEEKFNGVATVTVTGVKNKDDAEAVAQKWWREEYGSSPSKVIADERGYGDVRRWEVMIAQHSSGSLKGESEIEL